VEPRALGGTLVEPFGSPTRICPRKPKRNLSNLGKALVEPWWNPWWNLPQNLLAAQHGSVTEHPRDHEATLVKLWCNLGGTLGGRSWGKKICYYYRKKD